MLKLRRTTVITIGCISALVGLGLSRKISIEIALLPIAALILYSLILKSKSIFIAVVVVCFGLSLGLWRGGVYMNKLDDLKSLSAHKVTIEATATSDSVYGNRSQIEFMANHIELVGRSNRPLAGNFKISGFGTPMIYRGDKVRASGKLYPMRGSNQGRIAYAQLERLKPDKSWVNKFTRRFSAGMQNALPEPQASFGLGLLIGQRNNLPQGLTNQLIMVGLVHIVAVSGYNLTILVRAATRLKLDSKYQQLLMSLCLIGFFVLMTGFSASIVRAAIVSTLSLWAWFYGRKFRPILLISFAAAITGLANPFYVWSDLGWYLSFLAFFGVLVISPMLSGRLFKKEPKILTSVVLETLSAELMTLPLIMLTFGQLSLIGLLANAIIVPLIPLAMLLAAVAATSGMLIPAFAGWLAWPARVLLTFILDIVHLLSGIPAIFLHRSINTYMMLSFYAGVILVTLALRKHQTGLNKEKTPRLVEHTG